MFSEFKTFLTKTNALALAIGVVIGTALGNVVTSLVKDIIMPPIGLLLGNVDFSTIKWVLANAGTEKEIAIRYGNFLSLVIAFIVVAFVVFWIAKLLIRERPAEPAGPSDEVVLLTEIRDELRKG